MFNIKFDMKSANTILKRLGLEKDGKAVRHLRDLVDKYSDPYIPMQTGLLKNTKSYPSSHEIRYDMPYAHYLYIGKKAKGASRPAGVRRVITSESLKYSDAPKRGAQWDKRMLKDKKKDIITSMNNFIKKGGK